MGIEGVSNRIVDIQSRIMALQTQQTPKVTKTSAATATTATTAAPPPAGALFAKELSKAVAVTTPAAAPTVAAPAKNYAVNGKGIPTDLVAYGNGKIPAGALEKVGSTRHSLWAPAAERLTSLIADAKKDGVTIGITDSYRSYAEQVDVARRKGLYSQGGLAAAPGTSDHGWGLSTDLDLNGKALSWMRSHGSEYGFAENVPRESWHWTYKP